MDAATVLLTPVIIFTIYWKTRWEARQKEKHIILVGDFNAKHTEWLPTDTTDQAGKRIKDISDSFNLTQLCSSPTHLDKTGQHCSLLDLSFTNLPDYGRSGTLPPLSSSDHLPVMVNVNLEIYTSGQSYCRPSSVRQKRNFGGKSLEKML